MTLDRKGYGIHRARVLDGPADTIFDTFEVNPADSFADGSSANLEAALREALSGDLSRLRPSRRVVPRQLRHSASRRASSSAMNRAQPVLPWSHPTAPACWPTWRSCCATRACACMMHALPRSANAPKTPS